MITMCDQNRVYSSTFIVQYLISIQDLFGAGFPYLFKSLAKDLREIYKIFVCCSFQFQILACFL